MADEMLTADEFAAVRKRVDAATPAPWEVDDGFTGAHPAHNVHAILQSGLRVSVALCRNPFLRMSQADADFIAHSREDVPRLLATVEALQAREAAAMEIVWAVAEGCTMAVRPTLIWCATCLCIDESKDTDWVSSPHDSTCVVTKARTVLDKMKGVRGVSNADR